MERIAVTDKQLLAVWGRVDRMRSGQIMIIKDHAPNFPYIFIQCIKMWIDCYGSGEFSQNYKIFYKTTPFHEIVKIKEE
jgi:hypothetical protein